jgi:KDO2-lipid IV(A) lauroyltransferase
MTGAWIASRLLFAAAWCAGRLPLRLQQRLGAAFGVAMRWVDGREAKVARRNIALAMPELDADAAAAQLRAVLRQTGRLAFETLRVWTRPRADNLALIASVHGEDRLREAIAAGRGVIVAAPHYGNLELIIEFMASRGPFALVYRTPEEAYGDEFLRLARGGDGITLVPAEASGVRPRR